MFSRKQRDVPQISQKLISEESQTNLEEEKESSNYCGSKRDIKRSLLFAIFLCFMILIWILLQPKSHGPQLFVWTEQNTKYPKIESNFPPSEDAKLLPRLSFNSILIDLIDKEWIDIMKNSPIVGIDFEFNKGFSEKFRVVFESGHVAVVSFNKKIMKNHKYINLEFLLMRNKGQTNRFSRGIGSWIISAIRNCGFEFVRFLSKIYYIEIQ